MLNDLYFKTTCNIRPHFVGPMGGLKIEGQLYFFLNIWEKRFYVRLQKQMIHTVEVKHFQNDTHLHYVH